MVSYLRRNDNIIQSASLENYNYPIAHAINISRAVEVNLELKSSIKYVSFQLEITETPLLLF